VNPNDLLVMVNDRAGMTAAMLTLSN
jgi:hypothetical protein